MAKRLERNPGGTTLHEVVNQTESPSRVYLLLIGPDREQGEVFKWWLEDEGFPTVWVPGLEETIGRIHKRSFFMIILDIDFPRSVKQGSQICSGLKEDSKAKDIPLVVVTNRANLPTIIESLDAGADNFILKPFETHYFLERIRHIVVEIEAKKRTRRVIDLGPSQSYSCARGNRG